MPCSELQSIWWIYLNQQTNLVISMPAALASSLDPGYGLSCFPRKLLGLLSLINVTGDWMIITSLYQLHLVTSVQRTVTIYNRWAFSRADRRCGVG